MNRAYKIDDAIVVKPGVLCPDDPKYSLAGWQGRITALYPEEGTLAIAWDSVTLRAMPGDHVRQSEDEGLDWTAMVLDFEEVEPALPRDRKSDVRKAIAAVTELYVDEDDEDDEEDYADEGIIFLKDPLDLQVENLLDQLNAWEERLEATVTFPFEARIVEPQQGALRQGEQVKVVGIADTDDKYGLLVDVRQGRSRFILPLCELEVMEKRSPNYKPVHEYVT